MDKNYTVFYREVQNLRFKLQDLLDDRNHPIAQTLRNEVQRLEDEMEMSKRPRALEDRIKSIQQHLSRVQSDNQVNIMNVEHADMLHDRFEGMRMNLRRLPNY